MDYSNLSRWLDITEQQISILIAINKLNLEKVPASPKNIAHLLTESRGKEIQKSNLFTQIKVLMDRGFVEKTGKADYRVVLEVIKSALLKSKQDILSQTDDIDRLVSTVDTFFQKMSQERTEQTVDYLEYSNLFTQIEHKLRYAKDYLIVARFPNISLTALTYRALKRGNYTETLQKRCFEEKSLRAVFLAQLTPSYLFKQCLTAHRGNLEAAYNECRFVVRNLENQIKTYDTLEIWYHKNPFGFDIAMPMVDDAKEFFMFIRDDTGSIYGGMHIRSKDIAKKAHQQFLNEISNAKRLSAENIAEVSKELMDSLKKEYEKHLKSKPGIKKKAAKNKK